MRITTEGLKRIIREEIMKEADWFSKISLKESSRVGLNRLRRIIREEIEREQVTEIFGWSRREKEERARKEQAVDLRRDADFDRESAKNAEDWQGHDRYRTREGRIEIQALKEKIGKQKLLGIFGQGASRNKSGNPQMNLLSDADLETIDQIFSLGKKLNSPWKENPLGIKVGTFVPYASIYMDLWRRGVSEPQRSSEAGKEYAKMAGVEKRNPMQGVTHHPGGSHRERRKSFSPSNS